MENSQIVRLKEQVKEKMEKGDFLTLGKMLEVAQDTARVRFNRDNEIAVKAMEKIVNNRESFIDQYKKDHA